MKASKLLGMPVVSIDSGDKLGKVEDVLVDTESQKIVALDLKGASSASVDTVPVDLIRGIGKDAITLEDGGRNRDRTDLGRSSEYGDEVVSLEKLRGAKVLTEGGDVLGNIADVEFDESNYRILGYEIGEEGLGRLTGNHKRLSVGQGVRFGNGILIVPDRARATVEEEHSRSTFGDRPRRVDEDRARPSRSEEDIRDRERRDERLRDDRGDERRAA